MMLEMLAGEHPCRSAAAAARRRTPPTRRWCGPSRARARRTPQAGTGRSSRLRPLAAGSPRAAAPRTVNATSTGNAASCPRNSASCHCLASIQSGSYTRASSDGVRLSSRARGSSRVQVVISAACCSCARRGWLVHHVGGDRSSRYRSADRCWRCRRRGAAGRSGERVLVDGPHLGQREGLGECLLERFAASSWRLRGRRARR